MIKRNTMPSLTPMIDVVFLLLLFFLLSTQLQKVQMTPLEVSTAGEGSGQPPILIELGNQPTLDGKTITMAALHGALVSPQDRLVAIRPQADLNTQALLEFTTLLAKNGWERVVLVEAK